MFAKYLYMAYKTETIFLLFDKKTLKKKKHKLVRKFEQKIVK